jgi:thioredoxin-like negative regulator of GroEL
VEGSFLEKDTMAFKDKGYDDERFWEQVNADEPTLLAFWNHNCAPCHVMAPVFERLAKRYKGRMEFVAVSVYDRDDIAKRFGVRSTPTFILTRKGKALRHAYGVIHESKLDALLEQYAPPVAAAGPQEERRRLLGWFRR